MNRVAARNEEFNSLFAEDRLSDIDLALVLLRGIIRHQDPHDLVVFVHDGVPCSKARARWHLKQQRFYTPQPVIDGEKRLSAQYESAVPDRPWTCNIAIVAVFFLPDHRRIDADNLMKLTMDAATRANVWEDDSQVTAQAAFIELDAVRPRTVIALCPTISSLSRYRAQTFKCLACGTTFVRDRFAIAHKTRRYCSPSCAQKAQLAEASCPRCGTRFRRTEAGQTYCSATCAEMPAARRVPNNLLRPKPTCADCGGILSRRGYTRCQHCAKKGRVAGTKSRPREKARYFQLLQLRGPLTEPEAAALLEMPARWVRSFRAQLQRAGKVTAHERIPCSSGRGGLITRWTVVPGETVNDI